MRKLSIKILVCLLAITSIFGVVGMRSTSALAEEQLVATEGFYLTGAGLRKVDVDADVESVDDFAGIRFETKLTEDAYNAIVNKAGDKRVTFGIAVSNLDETDPTYVSYISNVTGGGYSVPTFVNGESFFYAAIVFEEDQFVADLKVKLGLEEYEEVPQETLKTYLSAAYRTLLKAKSYYQIEGEDKVYVDSIIRSMSMVAHQVYASNFISQEEWTKFYEKKNYFTVGGAIGGGYFEEETGKLIVDGLTLASSDRVAYGADYVTYKNENGIVLDYKGKLDKSLLGKNISFYVFDSKNNVTTVTVKYVTKLISTAEDLQYFNVDYTFKQATYDAYISSGDLVGAKAYVEQCMKEPFTYFDGYYAMINDITLPSSVNSTVKFTHPAVVRLISSTQAGFTADNANDEFKPNHPDAMFKSDWGEEYALPRAYYPVVDAKNNYYYGAGPTINFKKIGLMGTFDGQGHVIANVQTGLMINWETSTYSTPYYYMKDGVNTTGYSTGGAGIFGVLSVGGAIKNVGFTNMRGNYNSAGLVGVVNQTHPSNMTAHAKEVYPNWNKRATIENIYMKLSFNLSWSGNLYGALWYADAGVSPITKNVIVDAEGFSLGDTTPSQNGRYGIMPDSAHANSSEDSGAQGPIYLIVNNPYHTANNSENDHSSDLTVSGQLTQVTSLNDLYTTTDITTKFADNDYWVVAGNAVYFKALYNKATVEAGISLVDDNSQAVESITYDGETTAYTVKMKDAYGYINDVDVAFSENSGLTYQNGQIVIDKANIYYGTHTATFTTADITKTVTVNITLPTFDIGYLQEDGEWVESGISDLEGLTFKVDGIDATASIVGNKLMLDWEGSLATSLGNDVSIVVYENGRKQAQYNSMYVTRAIDEASELNFSVGYTFDADYYATLSGDAKTNYLKDCVANPFDYYDGYYVLIKDIDATGVEFVHDALGLFTGYKTALGYKPNETDNTFTATTGTPDVDGYHFPREGYPMMFDVPYDYPTNYSYPQTVKFVKIGFMGTFDGQGHIISNVNTQLSAENYKTYSAGTERTGAGIFGTINYGATIKNVAITNLYVNNSAGLALHNNMNGALDATADSAAYPNANKALIQDVFIQVSNSSVSPKGIIYNTSAANYSAMVKNVVVVADGVVGIGSNHTILCYLAYSEGWGNGPQGPIYLVVKDKQNENLGENSATGRGLIVQVNTLNELFTTTNFVETFAGREYWETLTVGGVDGVFFKDTYGATWKVLDGSSNEVNSITLNASTSSFAVSVKDILGNTITPDVTFDDPDALEYVDGAIVAKEGVVSGEYVVTFTFGGYSKSINVSIDKAFKLYNSQGNEVDSITFTRNVRSSAVTAKDSQGNTITPSVTFNTDALAYEGGAIVVKQLVEGEYEATFTSDGNSKTITVIIDNTFTLYNSQVGEVTGINFSKGNTSFAVTAKDVYGYTFTPSVTFNTDVLAYEGGAVVVRQGMATVGEFEATFTNENKSITINVVIDDAFAVYNSQDEEVDSITLDGDNTSFALYAKDITGYTVTPSVTFNTDVLDYVDGAIVVKQGMYTAGDYTATLTFGNETINIAVTLDVEAVIGGYLQEDGEWIDSGITDLTNVTFKVNGEDAVADNSTGKLMLTLPTMTTALGSNATIEVFVNGVRQAKYSSTYVSLAIDEPNDLKRLSVGYKFDQAEYEALVEAGDTQAVIDYLEACEAEPFDYYDGYYVLTKNINADGVVFEHRAVGNINSKVVGYKADETNNVLVPQHDGSIVKFDRDGDGSIGTYDWNNNGTIESYEYEGYAIPREGYPLVSETFGQGTGDEAYYATEFNRGQRVMFKKFGLMGTFDGQGHVISNVYTDVWDAGAKYRATYYDANNNLQTMNSGAGVFGIISYGATIKNVAFTNVRGNYSSAGLASSINMRRTDAMDVTDKEVYDVTKRAVFEDVYVQTGSSGGQIYGLLWNAEYRITPVLRNVVVVATGTNLGDTGQSYKYGIMAENSYKEGDSRYGVTGPAYFVVKSPRHSGTIGAIRQVTSLEALYTTTDIATRFAGNSNWVIVGNGVYFKGLYNRDTVASSISLVDGEDAVVESITYDGETTAYTVKMKDAYGYINDVDVAFSENSGLTYENGQIVIDKANISFGTHTATFTTADISRTLIVDIPLPTYKMGYLQEDGEWVESGITDLTNVTFKVNGEDAVADNSTGKLMLTLPTMTTALGSDATIEVFLNGVKQANYVSMYVTVAIDEKQDFSRFSVGYKFDQAEYDALVEAGDTQAVINYLEACEAEPFDYYEGYYVLTKDIDATSHRFSHFALPVVEASNAIGFLVDEANDRLIPKHENSILPFDRDGDGSIGTYDWDASGTIEATEKEGYAIPRAGYPILSDSFGYADAGNRSYYVTQFGRAPRIFFKKIGFMGTFDGQGYAIKNANTDVYGYGSTDYNKYQASFYTAGATTLSYNGQGAGVFGIINFGATIKNVAFTNFKGYNSAGLAMSINMRQSGELTAKDKEVYTNLNRAVIQNVYLDVTSYTSGKGILWYSTYRVSPYMKNVVLVADDITEIADNYVLMPAATYNDCGGTTTMGKGNTYFVVKTTRLAAQDLTKYNYIYQVTSIADLYTATDINTAFASNPYWNFVDGELYFRDIKVQ